jgi:hypothetical protein
MRRSHSIAAAIALALAPVFSADGLSAADQPADLAAVFLRQLLENSAHTLDADPQACLTKGASIGRELAAIIERGAADEVNMALNAKCEPQSGGGDFCTLSLSTTSGEEQASAGFTFSADPAGQRIDLSSLKCFQTP